ncbi:hypothetical protein [Rubrivivax gelatinosus]|nr:hypothetical protein [Rubrivivax gelatinosus]MBG6082717.1 hypothetical protein [Rubrivivax gelatinosus]
MSPPGALAGADRAAEDKAGGQILAQPAPECQDDGGAFAHLQAQAAAAGAKLHRLAGGGFLVSRWGWARECPDLAAVGAFLKRLGVRS